jgi:hypothetical protein
LYDGELVPTAAALLPVSWKVDDGTQDEILEVLLTGPDGASWSAQLTLQRAAATPTP